MWVVAFFLLKEKEIVSWCILPSSAHQSPSKKKYIFCLLFCNVFATLAVTHRILHQEGEDFCQKRHGCSSHIFDVFVMDFGRRLAKEGNYYCSINCEEHWGKRRNHEPQLASQMMQVAWIISKKKKFNHSSLDGLKGERILWPRWMVIPRGEPNIHQKTNLTPTHSLPVAALRQILQKIGWHTYWIFESYVPGSKCTPVPPFYSPSLLAWGGRVRNKNWLVPSWTFFFFALSSMI